MAGTTLARELAPARACRVEFALATGTDDADLRRLLRENPMAGRVSLSLEREPDFFAGFCGAEQQTIVARERGRLACAGWCVFRERFVNGTPRRVGYLGGLRLDRDFAGRYDLVRRGYEFFHELQRERPADFYFTSIAADNVRAQRFLERGLPGLPRYSPLADFVTLLLPVPRSRRREDMAGADACLETPPLHVGGYEEVTAFLNRQAQRHQLAPHWSAAELRALATHGLSPMQCLVSPDGRRTAMATLWNQLAFKQTVIRDYSRSIRLARPLLNVAAKLLTRPGLPGLGEPLAHAFISHLAVATDDTVSLVTLVRRLQRHASAQGLFFLTLGFDARDPRLVTVRRNFRHREYHSRLYSVAWADLPAVALKDGLCSPEVALL